MIKISAITNVLVENVRLSAIVLSNYHNSSVKPLIIYQKNKSTQFTVYIHKIFLNITNRNLLIFRRGQDVVNWFYRRW
jgi:hypothetical protein